MLISQRQNLIRKGILQAGAEMFPATVTFDGFAGSPVECSRVANAQTAAARFGGFSVGSPVVLHIDKAKLPAGLTLEAQKTIFRIEGDPIRYRVEGLDGCNIPTEPHVRVEGNNADR